MKEILEHMVTSLAQDKRIEIWGFGIFLYIIMYYTPGGNHKTGGDKVDLKGRYIPYFKPGKEI